MTKQMLLNKTANLLSLLLAFAVVTVFVFPGVYLVVTGVLWGTVCGDCSVVPPWIHWTGMVAAITATAAGCWAVWNDLRRF